MNKVSPICSRLLPACFAVAVVLGPVRVRPAEEPRSIDWNRARQIDQKSSTGLVPLDQLQGTYKGESGGLYGNGRNVPPPAQAERGRRAAAQVQPRDESGRPAATGKVVVLSMGMSNTTQEYSEFKALADRDPSKSPAVVLVDGAQGGADGSKWDAPTNSSVWQMALERLKAAHAAPEQVQVLWVKHALPGPARLGQFPKHAEELKRHIEGSLQKARQLFPNLRLAFLSSRTYGGYALTPLNPEPYAYESAFADRWAILDQADGARDLNPDAAAGPVRAPVLFWGPYLWADGIVPRQSDRLVWNPEDFGGDGTHPSPGHGRTKVARMLLSFFKTNEFSVGWFTSGK